LPVPVPPPVLQATNDAEQRSANTCKLRLFMTVSADG